MKIESVAFRNMGRAGRTMVVAAGVVVFALGARGEDRTISANYTLTSDETVNGTLTVASGVTVDLAGHSLTVKNLAGGGQITDKSGDYYAEAPHNLYIDSSDNVYVQLEYLQSNTKSDKHNHGSQWIDTGFQHTSTTVVDMKVAISGSTGDWYAYYGSRAGYNDTQFGGWIHASKHYKGVKKAEGDLSMTYTIDVPFVIHLNKSGSCTIDGTQFDTGAGGTANLNDYLFAMNHLGSANWRAMAKIYYCTITNDGAMVRDFVPAKRLSDGKLGMFDRLNSQFYVNSGSGDFGGGPEAYVYVWPSTVGSRGTLCIDVDEGTSLSMGDMPLIVGDVKLVKSGAGTLTVPKSSRYFAGGMQVDAGVLEFPEPSEFLVGCNLDVASGAVAELTASASLYHEGIKLKGGTLKLNGTATCNEIKLSNALDVQTNTSRLLFDTSSLADVTMRLSTGGFMFGDDYSEVISCVAFTQEGQYEAKLEEGGSSVASIVVTLLTAPVSAVWTGAADATGFSNPQNWTCYNKLGSALQDAVPDANTVTVKLAADADWRGVDIAVSTSAIIDLCGNDLMLSAMPSVACITDSSVEYELLEYLQSTGTQMIDTGYSHTTTSRADLKVAFPSLPGKSSWWAYVGGRSGPNVAGQFGGWIYNPSGTTYHYKGMTASEGTVLTSSPVVANTPYVVHLDNNSGAACTIDGVQFDTGNGVSSGHNVLLFAIGDDRFGYNDRHGLQSRKGTSFIGPTRIYYCKLWTGDVLERDFVPARRVKDGVLGMLDLVDGSLYPNCDNEAGDFIAGSVTNTVGSGTSGGSLIVDVAEGTTLENSSLRLSGALKLVKTGAGTFTASVAKQMYSGGTEVEAGVLKSGLNGPNRPFGNPVYGTGDSLLLNGAFDEGTHGADPFYSTNNGYNNPNWTVSANGGIAAAGSHWVAGGAPVVKYALFLQANTTDAYAYQDMEVTTAGLYRFAFSYAGRSGKLGGISELQLIGNGATNVLANIQSDSTDFKPCDGFVQIDAPGTYRLQFYQRATGADKANAFDNVSFTPWDGDRGDVVVNENGTLDMNGKTDFLTLHVALNGGTLANNGGDAGSGAAQLACVRLDTNSTFAVNSSYGMIGGGYRATTMSLGGNALSATVASGKTLWLYNTIILDGAMAFSGEGKLGIAKHEIYAGTVDFDVGCAMDVTAPVYVRNYTANYAGTANSGASSVNVYGTFKPVETGYCTNTIMQAGSKLDLTDWKGTWPLMAATAGEADTSGISFVEGTAGAPSEVMVTVDFARQDIRDLAKAGWTGGGYLLTWDAQPSNVEFVLDQDENTSGCKLEAKDDGLVLFNRPGTVIYVR